MKVEETEKYISWSIGKIEGSMTADLVARKRQLVAVKKSIDDEIEFIDHVVDERLKVV